MTLFKQKYRTESTRLRGWDYASAAWYFVTICTKNRQCWLGQIAGVEVELSPIGEIVADEWQKTEQIRANVKLDEWVIMPNHLHGIIIIEDAARKPFQPPKIAETFQRNVSAPVEARLKANSLGAIIGQIKSLCTKQILAAGFHDFAWQPQFYDHIIRDEKALQNIRRYILNNPTQWALDEDNPANFRRRLR